MFRAQRGRPNQHSQQRGRSTRVLITFSAAALLLYGLWAFKSLRTTTSGSALRYKEVSTPSNPIELKSYQHPASYSIPARSQPPPSQQAIDDADDDNDYVPIIRPGQNRLDIGKAIATKETIHSLSHKPPPPSPYPPPPSPSPNPPPPSPNPPSPPPPPPPYNPPPSPSPPSPPTSSTTDTNDMQSDSDKQQHTQAANTGHNKDDPDDNEDVDDEDMDDEDLAIIAKENAQILGTDGDQHIDNVNHDLHGQTDGAHEDVANGDDVDGHAAATAADAGNGNAHDNNDDTGDHDADDHRADQQHDADNDQLHHNQQDEHVTTDTEDKATVLQAGNQEQAHSSSDTKPVTSIVLRRQLATGSTQLPEKRQGRSVGTQMVLHTSGAKLYTWGLNEARLARHGGDNSVPEVALPDLTVISIAGSRHSAIATNEGHVWTMGHNNSRGGGGHGSPPMDAAGQLGRHGTSHPGRVTGALQDKFVVQVVTGRYHTMAVTEDGELYTWGLNDWGQLARPGTIGHLSEHMPRRLKRGEDVAEVFGPDVTGGDVGSSCTWGAACHDGAPQKVTAFEGKRIVAASAGRYSCLALDDQGVLWSWGYDGCANNGLLPAKQDAWKPRAVTNSLEGQRVVAFDSGYTLWIALTQQGDVYTCNTQDDGYAGTLSNKRQPNMAGELGRQGDPLVPGKVIVPGNEPVTAVAAGREHALAATQSGKVYTWGGRILLANSSFAHRPLVSGRQGDLRQPGIIAGDLANDKIIHVAAGEYFSLAASATMIYGWGGNDYFSVGVGRGNPAQDMKPGRDRGDVHQPTKVGGLLAHGGGHVHALVAGFQHSMAIVSVNSAVSTVDQMHSLTASVSDHRKEAETPAVIGANQSDLQQQANDRTAATETINTTADTPFDGVRVGMQQPTSSDQQQSKSVIANSSNSTTVQQASDMDHVEYLRIQSKPPTRHVADIWSSYQAAPNHNDIIATSPDIWAALPKQFDKQYRNPCWHNGTALRCLPFFHIIGVSKCGTTDLYHRLSKHPHMFESRNKGPHYYDECTYPYKHRCADPPDGTFEGYIDLYHQAALNIQQVPEGITGEASSNTYTSARGVYMRGPQWDKPTNGVTLPDLLYEHSPWLRLILMVRDPVDRYFSAYHYYRRYYVDRGSPPPTAEQFHNDTVAEIAAWNGCVSQHGSEYCLRHYNPQQLIKGMYVEFLDDWLRVFPRDQLLIIRNEDYKVSQKQHMEAVFQFLGMRAPSTEEWGRIMGMPAANVRSSKYEQMKPETRQILMAFYEPFNRRLAAKLSDNRFLWLQP